ncbi:MAG: PQQ-dependent sugar dehydrogenase [Planctomycetota bacterium]|jgi:quinoprotein glucose dehydrogenase
MPGWWMLGGLALLLALMAVMPAAGGAPVPLTRDVRLIEAWPGLAFLHPTAVVAESGRSDVLYVVERHGTVQRILKWRGLGPREAPSSFLDLSDRVLDSAGGGVLGVAFHPDHDYNGRLFVCYLAEHPVRRQPFQIVLAEFRARGGVADPASERVILRVPKSRAHHNGGSLAFGPGDGMLYVSTGDDADREGAASRTSQNPQSLLGKILRIDVDRTQGTLPYAVPPDNPWANTDAGVRREVYAYGMRNPRGLSFDAFDALWAADSSTSDAGCGQWVVKIRKGGNHAWPFFGGTQPLEPLPDSHRALPFVQPVFERTSTADGCSVDARGGFTYRGDRLKALQGHYVFGDEHAGAIYEITVRGNQGVNFHKLGTVPGLSGIGQDAQGELYFCSGEDGRILTLTPD